MNRELISQTYNGYLNNEAIIKRIEEYVNVIENNKLTKDLEYTNLVIAAENKEQALDFARNTAKLLFTQNLCHSYKQIDLTVENIGSLSMILEDIIIVNNYDEYISWDDLKNAISSVHKIVILCTTLSNRNRYKEEAGAFYDLFVKQVQLKPYSIEDICSAAKVYFEELKKNERITSYDDSFMTALDQYIRTVYPRSILQGREFIEDLEERIVRKSYETSNPLELTSSSIPIYFRQESTDEIEKNIKDYFCYSSDINDILHNAYVCANLKHAKGFTEYRETMHLNISGYSFEYVQKFANIYARLLNSDKYNLIHAKDVTVMNLYDVIREKDNFENKHGLIVLKDFELVNTFYNANEVIEQLIQIIEESNDVVWILFGHHQFNEMMNANNEKQFKEIFKKEYSLDTHDKASSENYIRYCYRNKQIGNVPLKSPEKLDEELCEQVLATQNQKEATYIIEKYIIDHLQKDELQIKETENTPKVSEAPIKKPSAPVQKVNNYKEIQDKEKEIKKLVQTVEEKPDKKEVNILLLAMSTLNLIKVCTYIFKDEKYDIQGKYISALEPIPKTLAEILAQKNEKLDAIYVLNTNQTTNNLKDNLQQEIVNYADTQEKYSAYTYFKERCSCLINPNNIYSISLEKEGENIMDVETSLYELSQSLNDNYLSNGQKINLYVDIHGGLRSVQTVVDGIIMLMKDIENIELKDIYTGMFNTGEGAFKLESVTKDFEIFNFVSGIKEFLSFGRSNGLVEFNKSMEPKVEREELVDGINRISDSIVLNRMEKFTDNLKSLSSLVNTKDKEKGYYDTIKHLIRANYQVKIDNQNYNLLLEDSMNFPAQLQWCLDKNLLQQALMLIENRTARALEQAGILKESYELTKFGTQKKLELLGDWVKYSFCKDSAPWKKKEKEKKEIDALRFDGENKVLCFKTMRKTELFNNMNIMVLKDVKAEIKRHRNNADGNYPIQYFDMSHPINKENENKEYFIKNQGNTTLRAKLVQIPINEKYLNNQSFLESLYIMLYVYKNLKWYRNTVAHPDTIDSNKDLKVEDLRAWIAFYIKMFIEVLNYTNESFEKPKLNETIDVEDALANLESRFGSKYKKKGNK